MVAVKSIMKLQLRVLCLCMYIHIFVLCCGEKVLGSSLLDPGVYLMPGNTISLSTHTHTNTLSVITLSCQHIFQYWATINFQPLTPTIGLAEKIFSPPFKHIILSKYMLSYFTIILPISFHSTILAFLTSNHPTFLLCY